MHPTIAAILVSLRATAALEGEEYDTTPPNGPADPAALAAVATRFGGRVSGGYLDFLRVHDGWPDCPYVTRLFGCAELLGDAGARAAERFASASAGEDVPAEFADPVPIGVCPAADTVFLLLAGGAVFELEYVDRPGYLTDVLAPGEPYPYEYLNVRRHADLDGFLADVLTTVRGHEREAHDRAERSNRPQL